VTTTNTNADNVPGPDTPVVQHRAGDVDSGTARAPVTPVAVDIRSPLRRSWKLIVLPALATMLIAWMIAALQPKRYRASALAGVAPIRQGLAVHEFLRGVEALERRTVIATVAALASTPGTEKQAVGSLARHYDINAVVLPNTSLFRVDVEGPDAAEAAAVANRVPAILATQTRAMFEVYSVTMVSDAVASTAPISPRVSRAIAAGLVLGLLIGAALVYVLHALQSRHTIT
jgi:hypothetical protein